MDVGNTNVTLGLFPAGPGGAARGAAVRCPAAERTWRLATHRHSTADEYGLLVRGLLREAGVPFEAVAAVAVASVVPPLDPVFRDLFRVHLGRDPLFVEPGVPTGVEIRYDVPGEVGADRIVNAAAAFARVRRACVVVDFGTATTFDCVSARGAYLGGAIAPGPQMAAEVLYQRTAKLPLLGAFRRPARAVGKNTRDSLASGLYHGYAGLTRGILGALRKELPGATVLATGGLAPLLAPSVPEIESVVPDLTLEGLWRIWLLNQ